MNTEKEKQLVDLAYKLARHIRNTDKMPALQWGTIGCDLLIELFEVDPERYEMEVKKGAL